jgi:hypothetical protein
MPGFGQTKLSKQKRTQIKARAKAKAEAEAIANVPKGTYKPGYDIKDFKDVSFKDYMRMKDNAGTTSFAGAFLGIPRKMRNAVKYIEDKGMVRQGLDADDLAYIDDKVAQLNPGQTHPAVARKYNFDADGVAAADKGNTSATTTYNDGFGGTGVIRNANYPVQTVVGPTSSLDNGSGRATVQMPPKQTFQEWQDLNKIARNPDYEVGVTAPEGPDMARTGPPTHPVTGLRIEKGDNWNSYTDAPSGVTLHNSNFNWNNKDNTPTGNVAGLSQQEIDVLYGRPPSPVQPKQEVDFSGFADWWRKNVGK